MARLARHPANCKADKAALPDPGPALTDWPAAASPEQADDRLRLATRTCRPNGDEAFARAFKGKLESTLSRQKSGLRPKSNADQIGNLFD